MKEEKVTIDKKMENQEQFYSMSNEREKTKRDVLSQAYWLGWCPLMCVSGEGRKITRV
jgi:hypothetical protein